MENRDPETESLEDLRGGERRIESEEDLGTLTDVIEQAVGQDGSVLPREETCGLALETCESSSLPLALRPDIDAQEVIRADEPADVSAREKPEPVVDEVLEDLEPAAAQSHKLACDAVQGEVVGVLIVAEGDEQSIRRQLVEHG